MKCFCSWQLWQSSLGPWSHPFDPPLTSAAAPVEERVEAPCQLTQWHSTSYTSGACSQGTFSNIREWVLWTSPVWKLGGSYCSWGKPSIHWVWEPTHKYFHLLFLGGHFYSVCFLKIRAVLSPHCLQQWPLHGTIILAFPLFLMHFPYFLPPASWDQVRNRLPDPSSCLWFCFARSSG